MVITKSYKVHPSHAAAVIGRRGAGIQALKTFTGVRNVNFDTRSNPNSYTLTVVGVNIAACDAVHQEVLRRTTNKIPMVAKTFIDVKDRTLDIIEFLPLGRNESITSCDFDANSTQRFLISSFKSGCLSDAFDMKIEETVLEPAVEEFLCNNVSKTFEHALDIHNKTPHEQMKFHLSPGKVIFVAPKSSKFQLRRNKMISSHGAQYMKSQNVKSFFAPTLNPKYIPLVNKKLAELGFELLNENSPETYTTVHLSVGSDRINFSVVLALDENLQTLATQTDDPRLSNEKKMMVEKILAAKTVGEVIESCGSGKTLKMKFFKLSRLIHPDKNLHPNATQAFQVLQHAYDKLDGGSPAHTKSLMIECKGGNEKTSAPPKVVKVKTKKVRICTVTTLSAKDLDVRGSLISYEEDRNSLSDYVRKVLNECWEERDSSGRIPTGKGEEDIYIKCVKQVLEAHNWAKEIPYGSTSSQTAVLEIKIKKLRQKDGLAEQWNDCVEIDLELNQSSDRKHLSGSMLAAEVIELKRWVDLIFN